MNKVVYKGADSSFKITGIVFPKDKEVDLTDDQLKALKGDKFGKQLLDNKTFVIGKKTEASPKPVEKKEAEKTVEAKDSRASTEVKK